MRYFMSIPFTDGKLPVTKKDLIGHVGSLPNLWSELRIYNFCQEQWRFLAPVFSQQKFKFDLKPDHVLPFMEKSSGGDVKEGAFGRVFRVRIHPAHQKDPVKDVRPFPISFDAQNDVVLIDIV